LHYVGSLEVLGQLHYMALEGLSYQVLLGRAVDKVKHELDRVGALLVAADLDEVVLDHS
jgi:hypothetical protein